MNKNMILPIAAMAFSLTALATNYIAKLKEKPNDKLAGTIVEFHKGKSSEYLLITRNTTRNVSCTYSLPSDITKLETVILSCTIILGSNRAL